MFNIHRKSLAGNNSRSEGASPSRGPLKPLPRRFTARVFLIAGCAVLLTARADAETWYVGIGGYAAASTPTHYQCRDGWQWVNGVWKEVFKRDISRVDHAVVVANGADRLGQTEASESKATPEGASYDVGANLKTGRLNLSLRSVSQILTTNECYGSGSWQGSHAQGIQRLYDTITVSGPFETGKPVRVILRARISGTMIAGEPDYRDGSPTTTRLNFYAGVAGLTAPLIAYDPQVGPVFVPQSSRAVYEGTGPFTFDKEMEAEYLLGRRFGISAHLGGFGQNTGSVNVQATLELILPPGFTFSSDSGVFLQAANARPVANAGGPYTNHVSAPLTLNGSASDPNGDTLTAFWDLNSDGVFGDATGFNPTVDLQALGLAAGTHTIRLRVTDTAGAAATAETTLTITSAPPNTPPVADAGGPYSVPYGSTLTLNGSASDAEADPVSATWDINNDGVFGDAEGFAPVIDHVALGLAVGTHPIHLRISDNRGGEMTVDTTLSIIPPNPLTVNAGGPYSVPNNYPLTLNGSASPMADTLNASWDLNNDGTFGDAEGFTPTVNPLSLGLAPGSYPIHLRVSDPAGGNRVAQTTLSIMPPDPFLGAGAKPLAGFVQSQYADETTYEHLWSFGGTNKPPQRPNGVLLASDGLLYGTSRYGGSQGGGTIFRVRPGWDGYEVLHEFGGEPSFHTAWPMVPLIEGRDGMLYGTTQFGFSPHNAEGGGALFKIGKDGTGYRVLHEFRRSPANASWVEGSTPNGRLLQTSDGLIYGITESGGIFGRGTLFRIQPDGGGYTILHNFGRLATARNPAGGLIEGRDGALYGVSCWGGEWDRGAVFKLDKNGGNYRTLHSFGSVAKDGLLIDSFSLPQPIEAMCLLQGSDGFLYGTTFRGGQHDLGTLYKLDPNTGTDYRILFHFSFAPQSSPGGWVWPQNPSGPVLEGPDGHVYTMTRGAGAGTIVAIDKNMGWIMRAWSPVPGASGVAITGALVQDSGYMYGVASRGGPEDHGCVFRSDGTVLSTFPTIRDGWANLAGQLIEGSDGAIYGVLGNGGVAKAPGDGILFKVQKDGGGYRVLHSFRGTAGGDGSYPTALIEGPDGVLYGTTYLGGPLRPGGTAATSYGTLFAINKDGTGYRLCHSFYGNYCGQWEFYNEEVNGPIKWRCTDFHHDTGFPGSITFASDGYLYGVGEWTSPSEGIFQSFGSIYRMRPDGSGFSVLNQFQSYGAAARPLLLWENPDNERRQMFGFTQEGGEFNNGTWFRMNMDDGAIAVLHSFTPQEGRPESLIHHGGFSLQGTTEIQVRGAIFAGSRVFDLSATGMRVTPVPITAGAIKATDGTLIATVPRGGFDGLGSIARMDGLGREVLARLFSFSKGLMTSHPHGPMLEASDGNFYGITLNGGKHGAGTLYRLVPAAILKPESIRVWVEPRRVAGADVVIGAGVKPEHLATSMQLLIDGVPTGWRENGGQNNFSWLPTTPGDYQVSIEVIDNRGVSITSAPVRVPIEAIATGGVLTEYFSIPGRLVSDLTNHAKFLADSPDFDVLTGEFGHVSESTDYGARFSGWLIPPLTGDYTFYMASDDQGSLFLSPDANPAKKAGIAAEPGWNGDREYISDGSGTRGNSSPNISGPITLTAGRPYYIEALLKHAEGRGHLSVAWLPPGGPPVTNGAAPIPGRYLITGVPYTGEFSARSALSLSGSGQVAVEFGRVLEMASATDVANYTIPGATVTHAALSPDRRGVLLNTSGLLGPWFQVQVRGVRDIFGNLVSRTDLNGSVLELSRTDVGSPSFASVAFASSPEAFDVEAGGTNIGFEADQFQFIYRQLKGDFDVKVRVQSLESVDGRSKAGLMAREDLSAGSRHLMISISSVFAPYEGLARQQANGLTTDWLASGTSFRSDDLWMRLHREGNKFTGYGSYDGLDWTRLGEIEAALPETLFVGMATSAGNNSPPFTTLAQYQEFSVYLPPSAPVELVTQLAPTSSGLALELTTFPGREYRVFRAESPTGPWTEAGRFTRSGNGLTRFLDPNPPPSAGYYRVDVVQE